MDRRAESQGHGEVSRGDGEHGGDGGERVRLDRSLIFLKSNRNFLSGYCTKASWMCGICQIKSIIFIGTFYKRPDSWHISVAQMNHLLRRYRTKDQNYGSYLLRKSIFLSGHRVGQNYGGYL